ncbi:hypothetical protein CY34DRAFT_806136 [Suillus luteus UH-Slu-Lm8-n1]|uniref:Uncharacterized protein n=1 Tax=Suillus luteus UH-Slu-Lm8-n1 TaxID=930992 RepID=A0A0D0ATN9_9AGAM|nr:hypothetical protein CY34DRAFT_806136 [Suillus luteus UH-Slu-Lm8-n1]
MRDRLRITVNTLRPTVVSRVIGRRSGFSVAALNEAVIVVGGASKSAMPNACAVSLGMSEPSYCEELTSWLLNLAAVLTIKFYPPYDTLRVNDTTFSMQQQSCSHPNPMLGARMRLPCEEVKHVALDPDSWKARHCKSASRRFMCVHLVTCSPDSRALDSVMREFLYMMQMRTLKFKS